MFWTAMISRKWPHFFAKAAMVGMVGMTLAFTGCEKWRLDAQVKELCDKDGGIKVYETVNLPADQFLDSGLPKFYQLQRVEPADRLGKDYQFQSETTELKPGSASLWRSRYVVLRRVDSKTLGELIVYGRRGGDLPGPWHESYQLCPENTRDVDLVRKIFLVK